jgi:hypothetical protein
MARSRNGSAAAAKAVGCSSDGVCAAFFDRRVLSSWDRLLEHRGLCPDELAVESARERERRDVHVLEPLAKGRHERFLPKGTLP